MAEVDSLIDATFGPLNGARLQQCGLAGRQTQRGWTERRFTAEFAEQENRLDVLVKQLSP
ncbi:hypothetical protein LWC34_12345 [Kibdelosporangium philippinense]|uniref:Uncharacterized protein n=1 Tax=Kibdelosporangium philippinense TaxID=211113 RepID=A0ABS8Z9Y3_9PSEU|nr:hypothetical protein [Kibdelosporangium philippinense]MCE7003610.1 hypothetical protein [Kibdelosporangium philippinense]